MTDANALVVDRPGIYEMDDETYHRDPVPGGSLSSTGARKLLHPSCPARFAHDRANPPASTKAFDLGKAAHLRVLGAGPELAIVDATDWKTKAAQEARKAAYVEGKVPVLAHQVVQVDAMAEAIRQHESAGKLLDPTTGDPEQSLFWTDQPSGVWCRARLDFLRNRAGGRLIVVDYKTTTSVELEQLSKTVHTYGYHQQQAFYIDGVRALGLAEDPAFVFVFQEKAAPYLVTVIRLDEVAEQIGRDRNRQAIETYRRCTDTGRWPGYSDHIELLSLPTWAESRHTKEIW